MLKQNSIVKILLPVALLFVVMAGGAQDTLAQEVKTAAEKTLYARLGGYDAVAAVVDDFIRRLGEDKQLQRFLVGLSTDSKQKLRQHVLNQFCAATKGPCVYTGRDMKTVHTGLGITESDWEIAAKALSDALDKFKVPKREKDEVLAFVTSLKKDIVEKK
jgi:hemoglobin